MAGIGRFVIGLIRDIRILESDELRSYISEYYLSANSIEVKQPAKTFHIFVLPARDDCDFLWAGSQNGYQSLQNCIQVHHPFVERSFQLF